MTPLPKSKIEKAAAKGSGRSMLEGVYFDAEHECFLAGNGFIAAKVEAELHPGDEELKSGLIPLDVVKAIRKAKRNILPGEVEPSAFLAQFEFIYDYFVDTPTEAPIIVLDAARLYDLALAICTPNRDKQLFVGLYLPRLHGKPVIVKAMNDDEGSGIGALMEVQSNTSRNLREALDELRDVLVKNDPIGGDLRAKLRHALVEG